MGEVAPLDPIYSLEPKHVWLRITNCEAPGRFQVILEINGGARNGGGDKIIYDSINECDGLISQHTNLSWLTKDRP